MDVSYFSHAESGTCRMRLIYLAILTLTDACLLNVAFLQTPGAHKIVVYMYVPVVRKRFPVCETIQIALKFSLYCLLPDTLDSVDL